MRTPIISVRATSSAQRGFTLIELLVVISIIAILAGLLLPVLGGVMENARKAEAKSTEQQIVSAVKSYQTEYGQYPVEPYSTPTDVTFDKATATVNSLGEYGHNYLLFNVLRASNLTGSEAYKALNSRKIIYFESKDAKSTTNPKSGFVAATIATAKDANTKALTSGDLIDPWGMVYCVRMDSSYSNLICDPYYPPMTDSKTAPAPYYQGYSDPAGADPTTSTKYLRMEVVSWSTGRDALVGKGGSLTADAASIGDDVLSWK